MVDTETEVLDEIFFNERLLELEQQMLLEDLETDKLESTYGVLQTYSTILCNTNATDDDSVIQTFQADPNFTNLFGTDPEEWHAGVEALLTKQNIKNTVKFGLSGLFSRASLIRIKFLAGAIKKDIKRLSSQSAPDYTKATSLRLPNYRDTMSTIDTLEKLQGLFEEAARSPKTIDPNKFRSALRSLGVIVPKQVAKRVDWTTTGASIGGALIVAAITGGFVMAAIGAIVAKRIGKAVSVRGGSISKRGWSDNEKILEADKRVYELLSSVLVIEHDIKEARIDLSKLDKKDTAKFIEANSILKMSERAYRSILGYIAAGLSDVVRLTAEDVDKFIAKHYEKKK